MQISSINNYSYSYTQVNNQANVHKQVQAGSQTNARTQVQAGNQTYAHNQVQAGNQANAHNQVQAQADNQATHASKSSAVDTVKKSKESSVFDKLKATFSNVNFVTGKDPFSGKNAKNSGKNTVYLDDAALRKLESSPRYAARVFADIESNMDIFAKGFSYRDGSKMYVANPCALNLSFYGKTESCGSTATCYVYDMGNSDNRKNPLFSSGQSQKKAVNREITEKSNNSLKKWYDAFKVAVSERQYYDFDETWARLQAASKGIIK